MFLECDLDEHEELVSENGAYGEVLEDAIAFEAGGKLRSYLYIARDDSMVPGVYRATDQSASRWEARCSSWRESGKPEISKIAMAQRELSLEISRATRCNIFTRITPRVRANLSKNNNEIEASTRDTRFAPDVRLTTKFAYVSVEVPTKG
jgi:hypothetical protein